MRNSNGSRGRPVPKSKTMRGNRNTNISKAAANKRRNNPAIFGGVVASVLLIIGIIAVVYVGSLAKLVKLPEFTGNPSLNETDIFESDDLVTPVTETSVATNDAGETIVIVKPGGTELPTGTDPNTGETMPTETQGPSQLEILETEHEAALQSFEIMSSKNVYNILLIGTDNRGNEVNGRSDTMMILSVNKKTNELHLVSLMRALYVKIPGKGYSMLNAAFSWGGAKLLVKTVEENFRVDINDYMIINFPGFQNAIDMIGGLLIDLTEAEVDYLRKNYPDSGLAPGINSLNGAIALEYARIRKIDSDFTRTGRQRTLVKSLINKASSMNAGELDGLARQMLPLIKTNLSGSEVVELALDGLSYSNYPLSQLMLPVSKSFDLIIVRDAQMYRYDAVKNIKKLQSFLYG